MGPALRFNQHVSQKITDITSAVDQSQNILYINYDNQESPTAVEQLKEPKKGEDLQLLGKTAKRLYHFDYPFKDASKTTAYQAVSEIKKAFNDPLDTDLENSHLLSSTNRYLQPIDTKPNFLFETKFTGAEIGTATHLILQYYDYHGDGSEEQLNTEIKDLIQKKKN